MKEEEEEEEQRRSGQSSTWSALISHLDVITVVYTERKAFTVIETTITTGQPYLKT